MKKRIIEIMKELWDTHLEFKKSRPETEQGYLRLNYNALFSESVSCYRGEQAGKNKFQYPNKTFPKKQPIPATEKQKEFIYKNKIDANTEKLTIGDAKKLIGDFLFNKAKNDKKN